MRLTAALLALGLLSCGGGGGANPGVGLAGPTTLVSEYPVGTAIHITSGETGLPVEQAVVRLPGGEYLADAGVVILDRPVAVGVPIEVRAEGYLPRESYLRDTHFPLWPTRSPTHLHEDFTRRLVYTSLSDNVTLVSLYRPGSTDRKVAPDDLVMSIPAYAAVLPQVLARMADATGVPYRIAESRGNPRDVWIDIEKEEGAETYCSEYAAFARREGGGRIVLCWKYFHPASPDAPISYAPRAEAELYFARVAQHELGHTIGLMHYDVDDPPGGLMGRWEPGVIDFSPRERLAIRLIQLRRHGNRFPDSDPEPRLLAASHDEVILD